MFLLNLSAKPLDTICFRFAPNENMTLYECFYAKKIISNNYWPKSVLLERNWKKI